MGISPSLPAQSDNTSAGEEEEVDLLKYQVQVNHAFKLHEIHQLYTNWYRLFPSGYASRSNFINYVKEEKGIVNPEEISKEFFRVLDVNKDGKITFSEYLGFMSIIKPTSRPVEPEQLITFLFKVYDKEEKGHLTNYDLLQCTKQVFISKGYDINEERVAKAIDNNIKTLLEMCDKNGDSKLTLEELLEGYKTNKNLLEYL
ncbi:hypothetical protein ABK040_010800 [Willaertia magna]